MGLAEYFDGWYADMAVSAVKDQIHQRHLGLPPYVLSASVLGCDGITEVAAALDLSPGDTLLDLACGRGGYGLEIAARTAARLVGVDFSAEAVRQARDHARRLNRRADFRIGELAATGLGTGSADAVMCVDAVQFVELQDAVYRELHRVLAPGGRAVLTCWEPLDRRNDEVPSRLRHVDLGGGLIAAGFGGVEVRERPGWRAQERAMWQEAAALDPSGDPALQSFHDEGVRSLQTFGLLRRVMAVATRALSATFEPACRSSAEIKSYERCAVSVTALTTAALSCKFSSTASAPACRNPAALLLPVATPMMRAPPT